MTSRYLGKNLHRDKQQISRFQALKTWSSFKNTLDGTVELVLGSGDMLCTTTLDLPTLPEIER